MFYLRVKGTHNEFMSKGDMYNTTSDLNEAAMYEDPIHAISRKQAYKASLGTVDREPKRFEIVNEEVARNGIANFD